MLNTNSTAILLFSRTAEEEVKVKTFRSEIGKKGNKSIAKKLINQSIATSNQTALTVFTCYSPQQIGNSFGERLANAIDSVFAKKYENVIVIGNDCPHLTKDLILNAQKLLLKNDLVLGPNTNGGVYLIGIKKEAYCRHNFVELAWETPYLQNTWVDYTKTAKLQTNWLKNHNDINSPADFNVFLSTFFKNNSLKKQLLSIISSFKQTKTIVISSFYALNFQPNLPARAPPICNY